MKISFLQTNDAKAWSGITTKNHLGAIYEKKPQLASNIISRMLFQAYGATLNNMLDQIPALYLETADDFTWKLIGSSDRNIPLVEARYQGSPVAATDTGVGANGTEFELVFGEKWFSDVSVIVGHDDAYPVRIKQEPYAEGTNWVYVVEPYGADIFVSGVPGDEFVAGKRFSREYSPVESTLSTKGASPAFTTPVEFRSNFSQQRWQETIPGNMIRERLAGAMVSVGDDGQKNEFNVWTDWLDFEFMRQVEMDTSRMLYYGRSTRDANGNYTSVGKSGHVIEAGPGIREQMEVSGVSRYGKLTTDYLTNVLLELSDNKLPMDNRHFVIRTGERGAVLFHRAIQTEASGWTALHDMDAQRSVSSVLHSNSREFGFQYTQYLAPNNIKVTLEVDPFYSDPVRNKQLAPNNGHFLGGVAEAYRMDIMDIGTIDGEPNLRKVYSKKDPRVFGYIPGLRDPYSPEGSMGNPKLMVTPKDGYEIHCMDTCAVMMKDPGRSRTLKPKFAD
jgi:hypothetical protein